MVGTYIPKLSKTSLDEFKEMSTELDAEHLEEVKSCDESKRDKVISTQNAAILNGAKESAEVAHLYVREYHDRRNPSSSQRVNNMRTTATLGGIFSGVMIRATTNIFTGA